MKHIVQLSGGKDSTAMLLMMLERGMPPDGLRTIEGMSGADSIPVLEKAIGKLADNVDKDYWKPTEGNAKRALHGLLALAKLRPDGVWELD